jgi:hypothetical protein
MSYRFVKRFFTIDKFAIARQSATPGVAMDSWCSLLKPCLRLMQVLERGQCGRWQSC